MLCMSFCSKCEETTDLQVEASMSSTKARMAAIGCGTYHQIQSPYSNPIVALQASGIWVTKPVEAMFSCDTILTCSLSNALLYAAITLNPFKSTCPRDDGPAVSSLGAEGVATDILIA
jgi:hypothetical protein